MSKVTEFYYYMWQSTTTILGENTHQKGLYNARGWRIINTTFIKLPSFDLSRYVVFASHNFVCVDKIRKEKEKLAFIYDRHKNHFYLDDVHNIVTHTQIFYIDAFPLASFFFPCQHQILRTDVARILFFLRCQHLFLLTYTLL